MSLLLRNVTNSIWHAFNALTTDKKGVVVKSKLKVLTANIGTLLDLYGVEKGLEHYRSTSDLNFEHYKYYLQKEVFSSLPDTTLSLSVLRDLEEKIDEVCWLVCRKRYLDQRDRPVFQDNCVYKLFRIFCLLAELLPDDSSNQRDCFQVVLHVSEANNVACQLAAAVGMDENQASLSGFETMTGVTAFRFSTFLAVLEAKCNPGLLESSTLEQDGIEEAITDMYHTYLYDVIKKGPLLKRGYLLPTLREYWFVLQPTELSYYKGQDEKEHCGSIVLDAHSRVDPCTSTGRDKLAALDHRSRLQWLSALQTAIAHSTGTGYQRLQARRRRQQRDVAETNRRSEEIRRHSSHLLDMEHTRAQLQAEKMARAAAESQARALEAVHREEERKLQELEDVRTRLEKLLEEETQAKRDEEIVRNLQARIIKAEERLRQLEEERKQLDRELNSARDKIVHSEKSKEVLEARLRVMAPQVRESDRVRRALSFMPSTKERPSLVNLRSHSLRRPTQDNGQMTDDVESSK
ncbi:hypothetical protein C0J52_06380 [Blattella germanica]|nr:hypothetical protein C0J52_06380 [Blattella germanica]